MRGAEPGGIFSPRSLGSPDATGEHGLGGVNHCCGTPCPLQVTLAGQDVGVILFS